MANQVEVNYCDLTVEDSWIDFVRSRLPYSFKRIEYMKDGDVFELSEPELVTGVFSAKYHNYWRRAHAFYLVGKLADNHHLSKLWESVTRMETEPVLNEVMGRSRLLLPINANDIYNGIQMARLWKSAQANILDRERVAITNVMQAVELGLKAVTVHARFREK